MITKLRVVAVIILTAALSTAGTGRQKVAELLRASGDVTVTRNGGHLKLNPHMPLLGGDVITTGGDGKMSIKMGGHVVTIESSTVFRLDEPGPERDVEATSGMLDVGLVYTRTRPPSNDRRETFEFSIQTPTAVAGVRGTEFGLAVAPDGSVKVGVEEGRVDMSTEDGDTTSLGLREGAEFDADGRRVKKGEYIPEHDKLGDWLDARKKLVMKNPLPAARRLTVNLAKMIAVAERLAEETETMLDEMIEMAREGEANRVRGQSLVYSDLKSKVLKREPVMIKRVRLLVRLDNRIQSRGTLLKWLVEQSMAEGSGIPPRVVEKLREHDDLFSELHDRAAKVHEKRGVIMSEKIPEYKKATIYYY